ncbi:MAG TPA: serine/threonine-protein kinase [Ktedonobacteraceae bacterium]|nr:serine/threonine-protein kinase [Ktedonobacteraceae bacterium]
MRARARFFASIVGTRFVASRESTSISPQNGNGKTNTNTQTGQLNPRTLLHKRYVVVQTIGQGGMAAVYEARDTRKGTLCAIKEMSLSTVAPDERPQAIQNFLAEAKILSRLNHPNLPAFTDFFTEDARHFLVMEFIDGSTLEELLERNGGPFSERRVLGWARQLCDVLEYLHSQQPPVIFRDMKPGNVMLSRTGRIKLIDFGIARLFRNSGAQDTQLLGTPGFAPPEQYGGAQTDERSDIYSLAMTLFQLLTCSVSETGFGLTDVHTKYPHVSSPVARALEKATSLRPEDRHESIVVFRRALLGVDTFRFENGGEATTPEELAELCARYPDEASNYLLSGEIESWLLEIGANDLARSTKRIRATVGDPEMGVNKFLQTVMGPNAQIRGSSATQSASNPATQTGGRASISGVRNMLGRNRETDSPVIVRPKTIDFGQVYPGLSAPMLLTISGAKGALVSGTVHPVESWIITDVTTFDGMSAPVRIRVDSTRLRGSTHYTGTIIVQPEGREAEIPVPVELDVLGNTTSTMPGRSGQTSARTGQGQVQALSPKRQAADDEDDDISVTATSSASRFPQPTLNSPYTNARYDQYRAKYGAPGSGGWEMLNPSARQRSWIKTGMTFAAAFMMGAFFYLFLRYIPPLAKTNILASHPVSPWFTVVLPGMLIFSTLGAVIVNWGSSWTNRDTINRVCTGLVMSLVLMGLGELTWQNLSFVNPPLQLFVMLLLTAVGSTLGTAPRVSNQITKSSTWLMTRMAWMMYALAVVLGGSLGYGLTSGFSYGCFAPFGALLGIGIGVALVLRIRRLIRQNQQSKQNTQSP